MNDATDNTDSPTGERTPDPALASPIGGEELEAILEDFRLLALIAKRTGNVVQGQEAMNTAIAALQRLMLEARKDERKLAAGEYSLANAFNEPKDVWEAFVKSNVKRLAELTAQLPQEEKQ